MTTDRLRWWEEIPLGLALLAQSYVVGLWYFASVRGAGAWADLAVAIGAGLALDLVVITTVMGRRQGRSSGWSWATSFGAFCCSSLIALDRYGWEWRSLLHVAFPLVVFLYSQHLATPRKTALETLPARLEATEALNQAVTPVLATIVQEQATVEDTLDAAAALLEVIPEAQATRYLCDHCGSELSSKQAKGNAARYGCSNLACSGRSNRKGMRKII